MFFFKQSQRKLRKECCELSPGGRTYFLIPWRRGSLTVEAAVVLPVFLVCMLYVMQLLNVYDAAGRLQSAMCETGEELAIGAYASKYGDGDHLLGVTVSIAYGTGRVLSRAGDLSALQGENLLLSSIMEEDDMIDLVCTYRMNSVLGMIRMPWSIYVQRAKVRAWTGRSGSDGVEKSKDADDDNEYVYVTEHGSVYHTDQNCTHIRLSIKAAGLQEAKKKRNVYGQKYHACEKCGRNAGGTVYITTDGNRYHSSLDCSGLKRTVNKVKKSEAESLRICSKCGGKK